MATATVDFDVSDYIDELEDSELIEELKSRDILPENFNENNKIATMNRELLFEILGLNNLASIDDVIESAVKIYNKK